MRSGILWVVVIVLFASCLWAVPVCEHNCACGSDPSQIEYYDPMPDHSIMPFPEVVEIQKRNGKELIQVSFESPSRNGKVERKIVYTLDGGKSWQSQHISPLGNKDNDFPAILYRLKETSILERSFDAGRNWEQAAMRINNQDRNEFARSVTGNEIASLTFGIAAVHPKNSRTIYGCIAVAGKDRGETTKTFRRKNTPGVYVSYDGGDNWSLLFRELRGFDAEGFCILGINPLTPSVMIGHGISGVVISRDGGKHWEAVGQQSDLERPALIKGHRVAVETYKRKYVQFPREPLFDWRRLTITQLAFDPKDENIFYLVSNKGLYKTEDGALTWCRLDTGTSQLFELGRLYVDHNVPGRIFLGTKTKLLVSEDGGCKFRVILDIEKFLK